MRLINLLCLFQMAAELQSLKGENQHLHEALRNKDDILQELRRQVLQVETQARVNGKEMEAMVGPKINCKLQQQASDPFSLLVHWCGKTRKSASRQPSGGKLHGLAKHCMPC